MCVCVCVFMCVCVCVCVCLATAMYIQYYHCCVCVSKVQSIICVATNTANIIIISNGFQLMHISLIKSYVRLYIV